MRRRPYLRYTGLILGLIFCLVLIAQPSMEPVRCILGIILVLLAGFVLYQLTRSNDEIIEERLERIDAADSFSFDFDESADFEMERRSPRLRSGLQAQIRANTSGQADAPRSPGEQWLYQLGSRLRDWLDIYRDVPGRLPERYQPRTGIAGVRDFSDILPFSPWLLAILALWPVPAVLMSSLFEYELLFVVTALIIPAVIGYLVLLMEQEDTARRNRPEAIGLVLTGFCVVLTGCTLALSLPPRYQTLAIAGLLLYSLWPAVLRFFFFMRSQIIILVYAIIALVYSLNSLSGVEALTDTDRAVLVIPLLQIMLILLVALVRDVVSFPPLLKQVRQTRQRMRNQRF